MVAIATLSNPSMTRWQVPLMGLLPPQCLRVRVSDHFFLAGSSGLPSVVSRPPVWTRKRMSYLGHHISLCWGSGNAGSSSSSLVGLEVLCYCFRPLVLFPTLLFVRRGKKQPIPEHLVWFWGSPHESFHLSNDDTCAQWGSSKDGATCSLFSVQSCSVLFPVLPRLLCVSRPALTIGSLTVSAERAIQHVPGAPLAKTPSLWTCLECY